MTLTEIDRFQSDIKLDTALAQRIRDGGFGLGAITETARAEGYDFQLSDLKAYVSNQSAGVLSDEQLASVAAAGSTWASTVTVAFTAGIVAIVVVGIAVLT
jgi:hypothetical protein